MKAQSVITDKKIDTEVIARYFLTKKSLSPKKIQKLVYYAYAWFITLKNDNSEDIQNRLFEENPQAWAHGPVFQSLYQLYKDHGWHEIKKITTKIKFEDSELSEFLDEIWAKFGKFSADELEYMTHQESPWLEARAGIAPGEPSNRELSDRTIYNFYSAL